jgi:hypothetical protein
MGVSTHRSPVLTVSGNFHNTCYMFPVVSINRMQTGKNIEIISRFKTSRKTSGWTRILDLDDSKLFMMGHAQCVQVAWRLPVTHLRHVPTGTCHSVPGSTDGEYVAATPVARAEPRLVVGMWTVHLAVQYIVMGRTSLALSSYSTVSPGRITVEPRYVRAAP